jgi:hypothetical protein
MRMHAEHRQTPILSRLAARPGLLLGLAPLLGTTQPTVVQASDSCATSGTQVTCTFSFTGAEQTFTVPAGVTTLQVAAIGAPGGLNIAHPALHRGLAARVTGTLTWLSGGQILYVEVGGEPTNNGTCAYAEFCVGGFNGGGSSPAGGGGGGGAADVRTGSGTALGSLNSRLLVAAGGGGVGAIGTSCDVTGSPGGDAGAAGGSSQCAGAGWASYGGQPGSATDSGIGGPPDGLAGTLGEGGPGGGLGCAGCNFGCGGGGGGSSLVPSRGTLRSDRGRAATAGGSNDQLHAERQCRADAGTVPVAKPDGHSRVGHDRAAVPAVRHHPG